MKRTIAVKMVFVAPIAVVLLTLFMASQAPFSTLHRSTTVINAWQALSRVNLQFWGLLMLPMYITLQTALIAGLDHTDNQWKALFARPVPRWAIYVAKLALVMAMVLMSAAILVVGVVVEGSLLSRLKPNLGFGGPIPVALIASQVGQMIALAFLFLTIQHWISLRWRSFSVAIGFGIVAIVTSFAMLLAAGPFGAWPQYFPWSLPMLVLARNPQHISMAIWICCVAGILTSTAGCIDFCKRDVT